MIENIEQLRAAIEVEKKYKYIDIQGKSSSFSAFIRKLSRKQYKETGKSPKWAVVLETFEHYPQASSLERKRAIDLLIKVVKAELDKPNEKICDKNNLPKDPNKVDVMYIKGVGPKIAYLLNKMGIYTANDLICYFPRKHVDYSSRTLISKLKEGQTTTVFGYITGISIYNSPKGLSITKVIVKDESGKLELTFFNAKANRYVQERMRSQFPKDSAIMLSGTVKKDNYTNKLTFDKPTYSIMTGEFLSNDKKNLNLARIVPIYTLCENLNIKTLRKAIFNAIELYKEYIANIIPDEMMKRIGLMDKREAVMQIHFPETIEALERARFSLVFEELFLMQLKLVRLRESFKNEKAVCLKIKEKGLVKNFIKSLPFELTTAQKRAINEILNDMNSDKPMARLLQGDVGSGKTVVACIMLLAAVENGYQGAIMAPTEILAQQHYNNLIQWLTPLGLSVGLFLGAQGTKSRKIFRESLENGQTNIAVGTHALIQDDVNFNNLGAIVVDEQHRFGVRQRNLLKKKSVSPQMLTMTATPIPRTLALTVHGDLDLTVIDELPKGRKPVITSLTSSHRSVYQLIEQEVNNGHQAYIVYPLINESETLSAKAATVEAEKLRKDVFPQYRIGLLHGKLKNNEKDKVMSDFKDGKYDILVSTTVVEVGVDVPNATVMIIENAERFGLSQLHQLRGRVGRSSVQSYCVLVTSSRSVETRERLSVMTQTNDGFVIAEKDLQLRGPGEFLGTKQSGLPDLIISDIVKDAKILELARNEAINFVKSHNLKDYPLLEKVTSLEIFGGLDI